MDLIQLYIRREHTRLGYKVVAYRDPGCKNHAATWPEHTRHKPRFGQKRVTMNCWPWSLVWMPPATA